jgi:hypothetical protein
VLTIRDQQMRALRDSSRRDFVRHAARLLESKWPRFTQQYDAEQFEQLVSDAIDQAEAAGFTAEVHVLRFLNLVAAFNGDFPGSRAWAGQLLNDTGRHPDSRLDLLVRRAYGELAEGVG